MVTFEAISQTPLLTRIVNAGLKKQQNIDILYRSRVWAHHEEFWHDPPRKTTNVTTSVVRRLVIRYEDLMRIRIPTLLALAAFLTPDIPSPARLACALEEDRSFEAYASRKSDEFAAWEKYEPSLRESVVNICRVGWCRNGYDVLLRERYGRDTGVDGVCNRIRQPPPVPPPAPVIVVPVAAVTGKRTFGGHLG